MKTLKFLMALIVVSSFQFAKANETESMSCNDRTQGGAQGVNVARLIVGTGLTLVTSKAIQSMDGGHEVIPAGVTIDLSNRQAFDQIISGCFDGTDLEVIEEQGSKFDAKRLKLKVLCDRHPNFIVSTFSLQCEY